MSRIKLAAPPLLLDLILAKFEKTQSVNDYIIKLITSLNITVLMKKTVLKGEGFKNGDTNTGWNRNGSNTGGGIKVVKVKKGDGIKGLNTNGLKNAGEKTGWKKNGLGKKRLN